MPKSPTGRVTSEIRNEVEGLLAQGVSDVREIVRRIGGKLNGNQVGGLVSLWRRRQKGDERVGLPGEARPENAYEPGPGPQTPQPGAASGTWDFSDAAAAERPKAEASSLDFGGQSVEYHVKRLSPTLGFMGIEQDPFNEHALGVKYGGTSLYEVTKYVNGVRVGTKRVPIGENYGAPRNPTPAGFFPRLEEEKAAQAANPKGSPAGELNQVVQAYKTIHDMTKGEEKSASVGDRVVEHALQALEKPREDRPVDLVLTVLEKERASLREQIIAAEKRRDDEQKAEAQRRADDRKDIEARATADITKLREEHRLREEAASRVAQEREKASDEMRKWYEKLDHDREERMKTYLEKAETSMGQVQQALELDRKAEREHQAQILKIREEQIAAEKARIEAELAKDREHRQELYQLQVKALEQEKGGDGQKELAQALKDLVQKADTRAQELLEVKKLDKLLGVLGPEDAKAIVTSLIQGGAVRPAVSAAVGKNGAAQGGGSGGADTKASAPQAGNPGENAMNAIAQGVLETPFFQDLLEIWAGHLKKRASPVLFASTLARFMVEDKRVELFFNWMVSLDSWKDMLAAIRPRMKKEHGPIFEAAEASAFFEQVLSIVTQRVIADHEAAGITAPSREPAPAERAPA